MSRQELAELVNTWIWDHRDKKDVLLTANYIAKLEQGVIRWPCALYREAFRVIFGVSTDSALGFVNARRKVVKLDNVKRQEFIHDAAAALGVGALAGLEPLTTLIEVLWNSEPIPIPARISATDIEQIHDATRVFGSWSRTYGGVLVREPAMGQLRWSAGLLKATCPDQRRPKLYSAVGALANTTGYVAYDAGIQEEARRVYRFALACAEQAKDWNLRANVLSSMAKQAVWTGQPDDGLTLAEQALVRPDRLTETEQAMLHNDRARALAKMRRVQETLTAIGTADEHFTHATTANDPPSLYNAARHAELTGRPLVDLAILGRDPGGATDRLTAAAAGHTETETRARAICLTKLATLTMVTGDPLQAAAIGHAALAIAGTIHSRQAAEELRELAHYAAAHQHLDEVAHLRNRIKTLICTGNPVGESSLNPPATNQ
ncbi:MAG: XRE family transcriptional regulator [Pseudonocardiaceae bacterium]